MNEIIKQATDKVCDFKLTFLNPELPDEQMCSTLYTEQRGQANYLGHCC